MALGRGSRLGGYEILSPIGAGGMGAVYRGKDTKLGRDVALKILPATFTNDPDRVARFRREAQVLASLNHPHIAQIYGLEEANSTQFLVLELVDGDSLEKRIARGRIPVDEALGIAKQIAEALEAAHEKGIIHRDLKPANIALTRDGSVKVLDFGLAKAVEATAGATSTLSMSPTITSPAMMTGVGVILGTAAYMSPEQARGKAAAKRSDIWAFGCVLYEMLTGKQAFAGDDVSDTVANVLKSEADCQLLPADVPPAIRTLLKRCLEKNGQQRIADVSTVQFLLQAYADFPAASTTTPSSQARSRRRLRTAAASASVFILMAFGLWSLRQFAAPSTPAPVTRLLMGLRPAESLLDGPESNYQGRPTRTALAWSPDGHSLVFGGTQAGVERLYLRSLDQLNAKPLSGTEGATAPFFSPDGEWVGFWARGSLQRVPITGGPPVTIAQVAPIFGATWADDNSVYFDERGSAMNYEQRIWRVDAKGGAPRVVIHPDQSKGEFGYRLPQVLPGGKILLFTMTRAPQNLGDAQIIARSLETGEQRVVTQGADGRYVRPGYLVFLRLGTLLAAPFDATRLALTGGAVGVVDDVMQSAQAPTRGLDAAAGQFSVSSTGTLAYASGGIFAEDLRSLVWVDRFGGTTTIAMQPRLYWAPRLTADGQRLAVYSRGPDGRIWLHDLRTSSTTPLTDAGGVSIFPVWTPDGTRVTFASQGGGPQNLFERPADGSRGAVRLTTSSANQTPSAWSRDGEHLAFVQETSSGSEIWVLTRHNGQVTSQPWRPNTRYQERYPDWSPDGQWLAYTSDESGRDEVYVQQYPGPGARIPVSRDGGTRPVWSSDGREVFFVVAPSATVSGAVEHYRLMVAPVSLGSSVTVETPRRLFDGRFVISSEGRGFDVTPDGRRFLMLQPREQSAAPATEIVIVQNWSRELARLVPSR
jgi:serine/threonine-protein kinase